MIIDHSNHVSDMTTADLLAEKKLHMSNIRSWFNDPDTKSCDYPHAARRRLTDIQNELTRRELRTLGWIASALIAGIAFFLGAALAYLI